MAALIYDTQLHESLEPYLVQFTSELTLPEIDRSSETNENLPPLSPDLTKSLALKISGIIEHACKSFPRRPASDATKAMAAKRVSPKSLSRFETLENYHLIIMDEIVTILDRILAYPTTTRYRKYFKNTPDGLGRAWALHSQSLRVGELYIVLDRTNALLKFLVQVGSDCGIPVTNCQKSFEKRFKKKFKRRLRERHRLVHAHERPSLESRVIGMTSETMSFEAEEVAPLIEEQFGKLIDALSKATGSSWQDFGELQQDVEKMHEEASDQEASQMLELVGEALLGTLNVLPREDIQSN